MIIVSCNIEFPMSNDQNFDANVSSPKYDIGKGPKVVIDVIPKP